MATRNKLSDRELANDKAKRIMNGVDAWCSFYRANPHRFCMDYLNIKLKLFQQIILYMMNWCNYIMYIAARGQGKTFLVAVFCCVRCILYPGTAICIASKTRGQSVEVLTKIQTILMPNSANLQLEIEPKGITINQSKAEIVFRNTSHIFVVTANDEARHNRANIIICDEFRMIPLTIIQTVLKRFLTAPRNPGYLDNPKYAHLTERNKEIYLSSAWYKSHWSFGKLQTYAKNMSDDQRRYFTCGLPYQLSIKEHLLDKNQIADELSEGDQSETTFGMEMECLWFGDTDGSLFSYDDIAKTRQIKQAIYPDYISSLIPNYKQKIPPLAFNERRVLSADVALLASKKQNNDAASIWINRAIPNSENRYISNLIYTENHEGLHTNDLALRIRRLYEQFHCTDIALDVKGLGIGVYDALVRDIYDPEYNVTYSPLSCCNDDVYAARCTDREAKKVIWAIQATSQFNNDMYLALRDGFKQNKIKLLSSENDFYELPRGIVQAILDDAELKRKVLLPYIHTTLFINEIISLKYTPTGTLIKVKEQSGMRKDRVSSVGYNYWVVQELERKLKPSNKPPERKVFAFKKPIIK